MKIFQLLVQSEMFLECLNSSLSLLPKRLEGTGAILKISEEIINVFPDGPSASSILQKSTLWSLLQSLLNPQNPGEASVEAKAGFSNFSWLRLHCMVKSLVGFWHSKSSYQDVTWQIANIRLVKDVWSTAASLFHQGNERTTTLVIL